MEWTRFTLHQGTANGALRTVGEVFVDAETLYPRGDVEQHWFLYGDSASTERGAYLQVGAAVASAVTEFRSDGTPWADVDFDAYRAALHTKGIPHRHAHVRSKTTSAPTLAALFPFSLTPELDPGHLYAVWVSRADGSEREVGAVAVPMTTPPKVLEHWYLRDEGDPAKDFVSPSRKDPTVTLRIERRDKVTAAFDPTAFSPDFPARLVTLAGTEQQ